MGVSPFGSCYSLNGHLHDHWQQGYVDAVQSTLCAGLIPVLHGDGILEAADPQGRYKDGQITPTILSGAGCCAKFVYLASCSHSMHLPPPKHCMGRLCEQLCFKQHEIVYCS